MSDHKILAETLDAMAILSEDTYGRGMRTFKDAAKALREADALRAQLSEAQARLATKRELLERLRFLCTDLIPDDTADEVRGVIEIDDIIACLIDTTAAPVSPEAQAVPDDVWVLQDARGMVGNAMLFWRKGGAGYTADLRGAETYTRDQAFAQHRVRDTDRPWPLTYLLERAGRMVDVQDVKPSEWHAAAQQPAGGAE